MVPPATMVGNPKASRATTSPPELAEFRKLARGKTAKVVKACQAAFGDRPGAARNARWHPRRPARPSTSLSGGFGRPPDDWWRSPLVTRDGPGGSAVREGLHQPPRRRGHGRAPLRRASVSMSWCCWCRSTPPATVGCRSSCCVVTLRCAPGPDLEDALRELADAGLITVEDGHATVRSWAKYNALSAEIVARRTARKEASRACQTTRGGTTDPSTRARSAALVFPLVSPDRIPPRSDADPPRNPQSQSKSYSQSDSKSDSDPSGSDPGAEPGGLRSRRRRRRRFS